MALPTHKSVGQIKIGPCPTHLGSVRLADEALRVCENNLEWAEFKSRVVDGLSDPKFGAVESLALDPPHSKIFRDRGDVVSALTRQWAMVGPVLVQEVAIIARFYLGDVLILFGVLLPFDHLYILTKDLSKPLQAPIKVRHDDAGTWRNVMLFERKNKGDQREEITRMGKEKLIGSDWGFVMKYSPGHKYVGGGLREREGSGEKVLHAPYLRGSMKDPNISEADGRVRDSDSAGRGGREHREKA